ncbi:alpha/beta fold hydrolase [Streptomyces monashensis]|uniref:alpha/beta fold hydrolase n=1 Tax=Streptomyces monashensis TaxID=1678012 RepID=UPI000AEF4E0B|nr:alpha/beta hydrolase [Streptomyces monashensis]
MTAASEPTVVLLHALSLHATMWQAQERALRAAGHPVIALDQRGFGTAPLGTAPPCLDVVADDVARALDRLGSHRAVLVGSSMGGYAAMAFLRRFPDRVAGLALLSARATADSPGTAAERMRFAELVQDERSRQAVLERATPLLVGATTRQHRPHVLSRVLADARAADPAALAWAQRAIAARTDSTVLLRATRVPAVVIAGAEDELVTAQEAQAVADALPQSTLVTVPGAGHLAPLEAPEAVTGALLDLLGDIAAPRPVRAARRTETGAPSC